MPARNYLIRPDSGKRQLLADLLAARIGTRGAKKLLESGNILVDGQRGTGGQLVSGESRVEALFPSRQIEKWVEAVAQRVLFQDDLLLAVAKRSGVEVVEEVELSLNSLAFETALFCELTGQKALPLHRLDYETSGAVLFAKSEAVLGEMRELFAARKIRKFYYTLVRGVLKGSESLHDRLSFRNGKSVNAISSFSVIASFPQEQVSLLEVELITGRFHQIRLQLARRNHPVLLDAQHGDFRFNRDFRKRFKLKRQFLHCQRLLFKYREREYDIRAPLESDLALCLERLDYFPGRLSARS